MLLMTLQQNGLANHSVKQILISLFVFILISGSLNAQSDPTNPYVEIKGSVYGRTVTMAALGSSPDGLELTYSWYQDETNPAILSFSSLVDEAVTIEVPDTNGEYYVNVTVTDANGKNFTARRIITARVELVFINTVDHFPEWVNTMNLYEINPYSWNSGNGIFDNVTNYLDRLVDLGINTIWFTPIFESLNEGMGYWTYDYFEIYSGFGTKDDFKAFVDAAHQKGVRIILDLVFNHTGKHHPFFQSCMNEKAQSPYADYYIWDGVPGESSFEYFYNWDQLPNLNVANPDVEEYLISVAEYWINNFDVDGYRTDVAWGIELRSDTFWKNFTKRLRNIKPEIYLLGEGQAKPVSGSLEGNPSNEHDKSILFDDRYNSVYDWELRTWNASKGLPGLLNGDITINELHSILAEDYPDRALPLRFIENHDLPRAAALFDLERSKLAHTLVFTVPGVPLLYCGAEMGQTEQFWALGNDPGGVQSYFQKIIQTRRNFIKNDAQLVRLPNSRSEDVYSYATISDDGSVIISVLNFAGTQKVITLDLSSLAEEDSQTILLKDVLRDANYVINANYLGALPLTLNGYEARVFVFNPTDNLIINGEFNSRMYPWYTYVNESALANGIVENNLFKMSITQAGTEGWHIQLIQGGLPLEQGEAYELSLRAAADQNRTVDVIISEDGNDYTNYFTESINLTSELSVFNFSFSMGENTDLDARFVVDMGGSDIDVLLDDISLRKIGPISGVKNQGFEDLSHSWLDQNYPNPFTQSTTISFRLDKSSTVKLVIYNIKGDEISTLINENMEAGIHEIQFSGKQLPAGYYLYELQAGEKVLRKKMLKVGK